MTSPDIFRFGGFILRIPYPLTYPHALMFLPYVRYRNKAMFRNPGTGLDPMAIYPDRVALVPWIGR